MQNRYRIYRRNGTIYYAKDRTTGRTENLGTRDRAKAQRLLTAKNQATEQPHLNVAMARVYLSCKSPEMLNRTWTDVMEDMELSYHGPTLKRWRSQMRCLPFHSLRKLKLLETDGTHFLAVLRHPRAGSSAHKWLRILHNRAMDLGWLLAPVLARKLWPKLVTKKTKAITAEQHARFVATEPDDEFRLYRYAWAQRAKTFGMPLREAMAHLGHGSKAIHLAYSQQAEVVSLPLEYYEKAWKEKIVQFYQNAPASTPAIRSQTAP